MTVSAPLPDEVMVTDFAVGVLRVTVPKGRLAGLTVTAGDDDPAGETFTVRLFEAPP